MENEIDVKEYRKKKTLELIQKYKGLIDNVFEIFDENSGGVDTEDKEEKVTTEQKKLDQIKKRSSALEQVDVFLDKIEKLEHHLKEEEGTGDETKSKTSTTPDKGYTHPTKRKAKT